MYNIGSHFDHLLQLHHLREDKRQSNAHSFHRFLNHPHLPLI